MPSSLSRATTRKSVAHPKSRTNSSAKASSRFFDPAGQPWERLGDLATSMMQLEEMGDDTVEEIHRKQEYYNKLVMSSDYEFGRLWADAWCAAFVWKKNNGFAYPITEEVFRNIEKSSNNIASWMKDEIKPSSPPPGTFMLHSPEMCLLISQDVLLSVTSKRLKAFYIVSQNLPVISSLLGKRPVLVQTGRGGTCWTDSTCSIAFISVVLLCMVLCCYEEPLAPSTHAGGSRRKERYAKVATQCF